MKISLSNAFLGVVIVVLAIMLLMQKCGKDKAQDKENLSLTQALQDTLVFFKNKDGDRVARISALETESAKDFVNLEFKDTQIRGLQETVKEYAKQLKKQGSVTHTTTETTVKDSGKSSIVRIDTIIIDKTQAQFWPTYSWDKHDEWIDATVNINNKKALLLLKVRNEYSTVIGRDKQGTFVDVIGKSPYDSVKTVRTYQVSQPPPKRFGLGVQMGGGVSSEFKPIFYVGAGLSYNFIRF